MATTIEQRLLCDAGGVYMPTETQDGSGEWITVECTSAGQFMLPPAIIYKGKVYAYCGWTSAVDNSEALFARGDKGFIMDR